MRPRTSVPRHVESLIAAQSGVVAVRQLLDAGITRRVIQRLSGDWNRLAEGLYATTHPTWHSALWGGLLRAGPDGVAGGAAALFLQGVVLDAPRTIDVWAPGSKHGFSTPLARVSFRRGVRPGRGNPPRTTVEDSLLDFATNCARGYDVVAAVTRALARQLTLPGRITSAVDRRPKQRHRQLIRALCQASSVGIESVLEWLFAQNVLAPHGLPLPTRQVRLEAGRVDALYEGFIVELDGERFHTDQARDRHRDNEHAMRRSLLTLRYGWQDMADTPCRTATQLADCLELHGWGGQRRRCASCAPITSRSSTQDG